VGQLGAVLRQGLVVEFARLVRVEARLNWSSQRNSKRALDKALSRTWAPGWPFRKVGGVGRDLVGHDAVLDVVLVGQAEVFLWRHVAQHGVPNQPIMAAPMALVMWS
jgi:hypothetical protein